MDNEAVFYGLTYFFIMFSSLASNGLIWRLEMVEIVLDLRRTNAKRRMFLP